MFNSKNPKKIIKKNTKINFDIPAIEVKNFTKKFKSFVSVKNSSLTVGHGVIHGFVGPNGSGKTTTIKSLIGAYIPTSGSLLINGHKAGTKKANKLIGYIPERASFPKHLNCEDYLSSMGQISGLKAKVAKARAKSILKDLRLEDQAKRKPFNFSSGMQKKILLAQALIINPSVLILDEPAANLDPNARKELFDELIKLRNEGKTILISSHILAELERIIDEVSFIYYGEMLFSGKSSEFSKKGNSIFIKSSNNSKLAKWLRSKNIKVSGDIKTEIELKEFDEKESKKLFEKISKQDITIISYRTNDLQVAYKNIVNQAQKRIAKTEKINLKENVNISKNKIQNIINKIKETTHSFKKKAKGSK